MAPLFDPEQRKSHNQQPSSLLSPSHYDDDASSIRSAASDQETDSEDDEVLMGARSSADIRAHDRSVLLEEEERDRLLESEGRKKGRRGSALALVGKPLKRLFSKSQADLSISGSGFGDAEKQEIWDADEQGDSGRRKDRRDRRRRRKEALLHNAADGEDGELMYEMEEGALKEGSVTGSSSDAEGEGSDEIDRRGLLGLHEEKATKKRRWRMWCFLHLLIAVGFSILVLIAAKLSLHRKGVIPVQPMLSNGTAMFAPTTILISLDGFRADFLSRGITPRLSAFVKEGVSPVYMNPSFPSVTFPNHYTLVTGLYPESHGIVGNTFWDEELKEEFYYTNPNAMQPKWWGGEPLWVTAEEQGIRTAIHMWPGSEAHIAAIEPAFLDTYNGKEALDNKVSRILGLLDKPGIEDGVTEVKNMRPQLIAAYVPNVDADGHLYGPNSTEIRVTIQDVDSMLDHMFQGLEARNLTNIVNVVIVSDHGMATTDISRMIQLETLIDTTLIEHIDGWPLYGLRPKNPDPAHLQELYTHLKAKVESNPNFDVYLRDVDMPERYHFSKNERIAPLWIIPKTGWAIVTKKEFDIEEAKKEGKTYHPVGLHGYDHEHPLMRAIFIARGPAFPHVPNSRVEPFQNIEVYNIVCDSLNLTPKPNNGTLRLPLKTIGLHSSETTPGEPNDPDISSVSTSALPSLSQPPTSTTSSSSSSSSFSSLAILPSISSLPSTSVSFSSSSLPPSSTTDAEADAIISISPIEATSAADPDDKPPTMVGVDPAEGEDGEAEEDKDQSFWDWFHDRLDKLKDWFGKVTEGKNGEGEAESTGKV